MDRDGIGRLRKREEIKFLVDSMLGKLARWLRILGYSVDYSSTWSDEEIMEKLEEEDFILLTRDRSLAERVDKSYLIQSPIPLMQLKEVIDEFSLDKNSFLFSRCVVCNGRVEEVRKEEVEGRVPEGVFNHSEKFYRCRKCGKIYWPGSHHAKVRKLLGDL